MAMRVAGWRVFLPGEAESTPKKGKQHNYLVDVGKGAKNKILAVKWIWISTTKPQPCKMIPNDNHDYFLQVEA